MTVYRFTIANRHWHQAIKALAANGVLGATVNDSIGFELINGKAEIERGITIEVAIGAANFPKLAKAIAVLLNDNPKEHSAYMTIDGKQPCLFFHNKDILVFDLEE